MTAKRPTRTVDLIRHPLTLLRNLQRVDVYAAHGEAPGRVLIALMVDRVARDYHGAFPDLRPVLEMANGERIPLRSLEQVRNAGSEILCYADPASPVDFNAAGRSEVAFVCCGFGRQSRKLPNAHRRK